jgi:uncharacterized protein YggE
VAAAQTGAAISPSEIPRIVTSAVGETRVTPDRATIAIGVSTRGRTAAQASADNARRQRAVIDTLKAMGIANEDYSTADFSVFPEEIINPARGDTVPRITGYRVSNTIRVEVRRIEQIGALLDAALAKGANGINSLQFFSSKADSSRRLALASAAHRARDDAEALACATGGHLGELLEMSTSPAYSPRPMAMMRAADVQGGSTPINPGEQVVSVSVVAQWRHVSGAIYCVGKQ